MGDFESNGRLQPVRRGYEEHGVNGYYAQFGAVYRNPHEDTVREIILQLVERWKLQRTERILDLACGSGEVTLVLEALGFQKIDGIDPYTAEAYEERVRRSIFGKWTFEQIADGCMAEEGVYDTIVCSFAAHLISPSYLPVVMQQLKYIGRKLVILTPHKRPEIKEKWGWTMKDEFVHDRVRARLYESEAFD